MVNRNKSNAAREISDSRDIVSGNTHLAIVKVAAGHKIPRLQTDQNFWSRKFRSIISTLMSWPDSLMNGLASIGRGIASIFVSPEGLSLQSENSLCLSLDDRICLVPITASAEVYSFAQNICAEIREKISYTSAKIIGLDVETDFEESPAYLVAINAEKSESLEDLQLELKKSKDFPFYIVRLEEGPFSECVNKLGQSVELNQQ